MKVLVKDRSISTSKGIVKGGDEVDFPAPVSPTTPIDSPL